MSNTFSALGNLYFFYWGTMNPVKTFLSIMFLNIHHLFFFSFQTTSFLIIKITKVQKLHEDFPYSPLPHSSNLPNSIFFHLTWMPIRPHEFEHSHLIVYLNLAIPLSPLDQNNLSAT